MCLTQLKTRVDNASDDCVRGCHPGDKAERKMDTKAVEKVALPLTHCALVDVGSAAVGVSSVVVVG